MKRLGKSPPAPPSPSASSADPASPVGAKPAGEWDPFASEMRSSGSKLVVYLQEDIKVAQDKVVSAQGKVHALCVAADSSKKRVLLTFLPDERCSLQKWCDVKANPAISTVALLEEAASLGFLQTSSSTAIFFDCSVLPAPENKGTRGAVPVFAYKLDHTLISPKVPLLITQKIKVDKTENGALLHVIIRANNASESAPLANVSIVISLRSLLVSGAQVRRSRSQPSGAMIKDSFAWKLSAFAAGSARTLQARFEIVGLDYEHEATRLPIQAKYLVSRAVSGARVLGKVTAGDEASTCNARTQFTVAF